MLGYGSTDMPLDSKEYSTKRLTDDLAALLDLLSIQKAVIIGHDWGSFIAGRFALFHPARLLGLIILSIPYTPPSPVYISIEEVARRVKDLGYQVYFADDSSTQEIESNLAVFLLLMYSQPQSGYSFTKEGDLRKFMLGDTKLDVNSHCLLTREELRYYDSQFKRGMHGPLSYYRTSKVRQEEEQAAKLPSNLRSDFPVLFFWGTADPTCTQSLIQKSYKFIPRLQDIPLEFVGHWLMVEAKDIVTEKVLRWLEEFVILKVKL
jgi:soluble epoxide hydrolase/lipid-phosphate phosphatase